jgi:hypothetical protein
MPDGQVDSSRPLMLEVPSPACPPSPILPAAALGSSQCSSLRSAQRLQPHPATCQADNNHIILQPVA